MYRIAVTNRHICKEDFLERIEKLAKSDHYNAILLREKDLSEEQYEKLANSVLQICRHFNKKCILHYYADVAKRLQHPYIHLPLSVLTERSQENLCFFKEIGSSVHSIEQLQMAVEHGVTYVSAGHIFTTDCKKDLPPRGLDFLKTICEKSTVPVFGIGGINARNESQILEHGAKGVCIMSGCMLELRLR